MTPVGVFFCWQGGAERDFVNSTNLRQISTRLPFDTGTLKGVSVRAGDSLCSLSISSKLFAP